jgi:hypothetical protein
VTSVRQNSAALALGAIIAQKIMMKELLKAATRPLRRRLFCCSLWFQH